MKQGFKMKKQIKLVFLAIMIALLQACGGDDTGSGSASNALAKIDTNSPDGAMMAVIQSFKHNDIKALLQASMSQEEFDEAVSEFEKAKASVSEADKAQFEQMMGMLTADGAEDQIMAMATPQLEQLRAQLPMLLMMGKGMASSTIQSSTDIPDNQKETATKAVNALLDFVEKNDILSEEVTRKAISAAVSTAKSLDMKTLDDLQNLSFDDAMGKASVVMGGFKNVLGAYGISFDELLNSIEVSDVNQSGDSASMKLAYEFLGQSFDQDVKMSKKEGKWVAEK